MADFQTSTHREKWILTPHDIVDKHQSANERAKRALSQNKERKSEEGSKENGGRESRSKLLNCDEEKLMRTFYEKKIQEVCSAFQFPHKIQATAIIYFKRFYLNWSVMEHHPKHIMLTCVYAACKIEESHVSAEELGKGIEQDHQVILDNEMTVFQGLGFDLIVYAPYRSIEGFVVDIENFAGASDSQLEMFKELKEVAISEADKIMLTDAPLLFPPGMLALAALHKANQVQGVVDFERYLDDIASRRSLPHGSLELTEPIEAISALVGTLCDPTARDMKHIDRKLKACLDPSSREEKKREKRSKHKSRKTMGEAPAALPG